uniref:Proteasome activator PA28 N-terminal domain-containing protein n=1 Tax=Ditylenchus dipsaci TaxID=166011 RepID=A0A915D3E6_9BILA
MNSATAALERSKKTEAFSQLTSYRELLLNEAENIVLDKFPRKVSALPVQDGVKHETSCLDGPNAKRWKSDVGKMEGPGTPVYALKMAVFLAT